VDGARCSEAAALLEASRKRLVVSSCLMARSLFILERADTKRIAAEPPCRHAGE